MIAIRLSVVCQPPKDSNIFILLVSALETAIPLPLRACPSARP